MSQKYRLCLLIVSLCFLVVVGCIIEGDFTQLLQKFWFTSGFLLLILLSLVDQPYFSKDSSIFINSITGGVSLMLIPETSRGVIYSFFGCIIIYLCISSAFFMVNRGSSYTEHSFMKFFSKVNLVLGKPNVIFSSLFLWSIFNEYNNDQKVLGVLFIFWCIYTLLSITSISNVIENLFAKGRVKSTLGIGKIIGIQSKNTYLVELVKNQPKIEVFSLVEFKCSADGIVRRGLVYEILLLDQEQRIKVIANDDIFRSSSNITLLEKYDNDIVYEISSSPEQKILTGLIGIVTDGSTISKIKFHYIPTSKISEGDLVEVEINGRKVLYQVLDGKTEVDVISNKNQSGFIIGEAMQLGTWNESLSRFEKFGWLPNINSLVLNATTVKDPKLSTNELHVGNIPGTNYPVIMNKHIAITHHLAVVGITGTGKSVFSRNLLREYLKDEDIKVVCVDFTGEYKGKFKDLRPVSIISESESGSMFNKINIIEKQINDNYNKDTEYSIKLKKEIYDDFIESVSTFMASDDHKLAIFELPEVDNTTGVMKYTQTFFKSLFKIAKEKNSFGKKVCLVLEEAHTVIPEMNFAGVTDATSKSLINSIAQIALQGRKYNIGLLVICQRTANVSKTILTQCNSIISFQEYDNTSIDFLSNYFGQDIANSVTDLKFRQALVAGKAFKSNVPMIFEVPEINESDYFEDNF